MSKRIIAVTGATGRQGGGVVEALLTGGSFAVRAVTRNPESEAGKALAARGVEVVRGEWDDTASLTKAFEGAYGVFGVTDFWTSGVDKETQHGKNLVDAAKAAGVQHFVWSTLDRGPVPHANSKAEVNDYLIPSGVPYTLLFTCWYIDNIGTFAFQINKDEKTGGLIFDNIYATDGPLVAIDSYDIGKFAAVAFKRPDEFLGKGIQAASYIVTPREIALAIERQFNVPVSLGPKGGLSLADFDALRGSVMEELWLNMKFLYDNSLFRGDPRDAAKLLAKEGFKLKSLDDSLKTIKASGKLGI